MVSDRRGFGERLKRQRERAGVTLQQISQNTKVPVALFAGLEAGDCSRWPIGLYARAYIRGYAEAIGLNPDETVEEFGAAFGKIATTEGSDSAPVTAGRTPPLRLSIVEDTPVDLAAAARRAGLAACDLLIGALAATLAHLTLGAPLWVTVGVVLAYFTIGRLISDDPLLYWIYKSLRHAPQAAALPSEGDPEVSPVADTASTVA